MDIKLSVVLAMMVAILFPAMSIYAWQTTKDMYTEDTAVEMAIHFLRNSPTFKFDGISESVQVTGVYRARTVPPTWAVNIEFKCLHSGYGDRTGMALAQVITPHQMAVTVQEGKVIDAVIDNRWDEIEQRDLTQSELLLPEYARDLAIDYILQKHEELSGILVPTSWETRNLTPQGLVGSSKLQYTGDGWTVNVTYPVVLKPVYTFEMEYRGEVNFQWRGTVDQDAKVEELDYEKIG